MPLTDEHTFPDGLGPQHILLGSCCYDCLAIIGPYEQYCQRTLMHAARVRHGIRSSKKKPRKPVYLTFSDAAGAITRREFPDPKTLPLVLTMPIFPVASLVSGEPMQPVGDLEVFYKIEGTIEGPMREMGADTFVSEKLKFGRLAQMVAKIAHSHACATFGLENFMPLLREVILGRDAEFQKFVGSEKGHEVPTPLMHELKFIGMKSKVDENVYLVAQMRFFGAHGTPIYHAVTGIIPSQEQFEALLARSEQLRHIEDTNASRSA